MTDTPSPDKTIAPAMDNTIHPRHYVIRPNKAAVPLIAIDELPEMMRPDGIPVVLGAEAIDKWSMARVGDVTTFNGLYAASVELKTFVADKVQSLLADKITDEIFSGGKKDEASSSVKTEVPYVELVEEKLTEKAADKTAESSDTEALGGGGASDGEAEKTSSSSPESSNSGTKQRANEAVKVRDILSRNRTPTNLPRRPLLTSSLGRIFGRKRTTLPRPKTP